MKTLLLSVMLISGISGVSISQILHTCTEMPAPSLLAYETPAHLPQAVSRAVSYKPQYGLYWNNGSTIAVKFIGGSTYVRERVKYYAGIWSRYANINFRFVSYGKADLRISFVENGSSWSVIGKQALQVSQQEPTMNFGWLNNNTPEFEFKRTILHEFGHALGLLHEHQNPSGGIPWDITSVYNHYWRTQGWDQKTTYQNVIQKVSRDATQFSAYDPESIMHYPVASSLTDGRYEVGMNLGLSATDIAYVQQIYPGRNRTGKEQTAGWAGGDASSDIEDVLRPQPDHQDYTVSIRNQLGQSQVRELVDLYIGGEKFTFHLDQQGQRQKTLRFKMKPGKYPYRLSSKSTYRFSRSIWNGWRYVNRNYDKIIYGNGSGTLHVTGNDELTLYGDYNAETGRMLIYLDGTAVGNLPAATTSASNCRKGIE